MMKKEKRINNMNCPICSCNYEDKIMEKVSNLHLCGSEDDYLCPRCRLELGKFARSLQAVAQMVRYNE